VELARLVVVAAALVVAARWGVSGSAVGGVLVAGTMLGGWVRERPVEAGGRLPSWGTLAAGVALGAIVVVVGLRADHERRRLDEPARTGTVEGVAWIVRDPERSEFGVRTVLRLDGARYWTEVPTGSAAELRGSLVGDRVHVRGRVAPFRGARDSWRWSRHLAGVLRVDTVSAGPPAPAWFAVPNALRRLLVAGASGLDEDRRALYLGLVVGDDRDQTDLDRFRFRASGLGHLLAVSGQNVSLTLAAAAPVLFRLPRRLRPLAGVVVVGLFVVVTRAEPSVLRASVMAVVVLVAASEGRVAGGVRALAWSVAALVVVDPLLVHSLGFVLSVVATLGLALGSGSLTDRLVGPRWWRELLGASLAAQVATLPVQLAAFGVVPAAAPLANVLAVPAAGAVVVLGASVGVVAGLVHPVVGEVLVLPAALLVGWIDAVAAWVSRLPIPPLDAPRAAMVLVGGSLAWSVGRERRWWFRAVVVAAGLGLLATALVPVPPSPGRHRLTGSSVLEVAADGRRRVAVAPGASGLDVLDALWRLGVVRVDEVSGPPGARAVVAVAEQFGADVSTPRAGGVGE